ncbi:hypothetical protein [Facklamia sp. 7083-14-GEN3]|uniref:hypothetical protein n=1 Tax=Facklamia sp. 7083-14-GEN3 TaxID=2973478 RepID=UPI00215D0E0D|nr:hypothetical protein [Facklamia sp. 7083-14-GEN3]MCR8969275.1 hypothetical protein [Facklamia sp. 7083-14-GEN3]
MSKFKFKLNQEGVRDLLKSEEMQSILMEKASSARDRCGDGYSTSLHVGKNRANASVMAETIEARKDNSKNNTILKAVR